MHQTSTGTKKKIQQLLRSGPIVAGNFSLFFWCLCRFGASSGFVFFGACAGLVTLTSQNIDRHQKNKKQTTRCTKHRQAPKKQKQKKIQQLFRSGPIVPGNFSFFVFFGACAGLVTLDCVCLDLGHILNWCFKEANIPLSLNSYATTQVAWF